MSFPLPTEYSLMSRISLVYPSDGLCYKFARARTRRMPLGLSYLSAEETVKQALKNDPEFLGIGCTTPLYHQATAIIEEVKKHSPSTVVIFGGPHVSALPEATLDTSKADFVCIGEAEESVVAIV